MAGFFPTVKKPIRYEGPGSDNPLAFKVYDRTRKVAGRTMEQHLKFAVCYWHTFKGTGADPFGGPVYDRPWDQGGDPMDTAFQTLDAAFEFISKLGVKYWCFHDREIAPEGATIAATNRQLQAVVDRAAGLQKATGVKLLWGTANLFSHPRYTNGAATNPDPLVFAHAAAQVRRALDATVALGGTGYVFWGGREGYASLINTDMQQEREQFARLLHLTVDYAKKAGFKGKFFIEPKPKEPSTHQYDFDAATVIGFLREFGLTEHFQLNVEANHATLATHTFAHELQTASDAGMLGSVDINRGDATVGWDTDQFPTDLYDTTLAMYTILNSGGFTTGGLNFDAKLRRQSIDPTDLFYAHIGAMDAFARGLKNAAKMIKDKRFAKAVKTRYAGWNKTLGKKIESGKAGFEELEAYTLKNGEPEVTSGRQEMLENMLNDYV